MCKKLWGEIWSCPEIKKNGRLGDAQHGVDIYGIPKGESQYYGIQCKNKDENTNSTISKMEIIKEISNATSFKPPLGKLYFATTASKNAEIEEFVRGKNLENLKKGLFGVEVYFWEDIVDLIDENRETYDFYINSNAYKTNKSVSVTFQNGETKLFANPKFLKKITSYRLNEEPDRLTSIENQILKGIRRKNLIFSPSTINLKIDLSAKFNLSFLVFAIRIHNTGKDPIEESKLELNFQGDINEISDNNIISNSAIRKISFNSDIGLFKDEPYCEIYPSKNVLVSDDYYNSNEIFLKPSAKDSEITISWRLLSKDFKEQGDLTLMVKPDFKIQKNEFLIDDPAHLGTFEETIEDLIVDEGMEA